MKQLYNDIAQVVDDLTAIKGAIIDKGVEVSADTPTSEYGGKIDEVYQKGVEAGYQDGYAQGQTDRVSEVNEGEEV